MYFNKKLLLIWRYAYSRIIVSRLGPVMIRRMFDFAYIVDVYGISPYCVMFLSSMCEYDTCDCESNIWNVIWAQGTASCATHERMFLGMCRSFETECPHHTHTQVYEYVLFHMIDTRRN